MVDPTEFDKMINWAFVVATVIYALIGYAGYLMYGNTVSDEVCVIYDLSMSLADCSPDQHGHAEYTRVQSPTQSGCSLDART